MEYNKQSISLGGGHRVKGQVKDLEGCESDEDQYVVWLGNLVGTQIQLGHISQSLLTSDINYITTEDTIIEIYPLQHKNGLDMVKDVQYQVKLCMADAHQNISEIQGRKTINISRIATTIVTFERILSTALQYQGEVWSVHTDQCSAYQPV